MFEKSVRYYDALYHFKDYHKASDDIHGLIEQRRPGAKTLLDVACGTGKHLEHLGRWYEAEGLDINPEMVSLARERCPGISIHVGDMVDFDLGRRFDVVTSLFSSIAYVKTLDRLGRAIGTMRRHLNPGGLLLVEPWIDEDSYWKGRLIANFADHPDLKIAWMYTQGKENKASLFDIHYLVGTPDGVEHFTEKHVMGLFSRSEYETCFRDAGLNVDYFEEGPFGRGLYLGKAPK